MLESVQIVPQVDIWDVLRTPVFRILDACAVSNLPRLPPTLENLTYDGNLNQIQFGSTFEGCLPNEEAPILIPWSSTFAEYPVNGGDLNLIQFSTAPVEQFAPEGNFALIQIEPSRHFVEDFPQDGDAILLQPTLRWSISPDGEFTVESPTTEDKSWFEFGCNALSSAVEALADYNSESERKARESVKRFYRKTILSTAVSKDGHLSFLVPSSQEACVETAARDHVVHLEVITLAEEQGAPATSAVAQILISGGELWTRLRNRLLNLFSRFLRRTLLGGFTPAGLNFASAEPLLPY
jgi:hypothetical protein